MKRLIGIIMSIVIIFTTFNLSAFSAEVKPIHSETWWTGYYTTSDLYTTYMFIKCQADVYSNGTIKLYMWNSERPETSDLEAIMLIGTDPYSTDSMEYAAYTQTTLYGNTYKYVPTGTNYVDLSYCPNNYSVRQVGGYYTVFTDTGISYTVGDVLLNGRKYVKVHTHGAEVRDLPVYESRPDTPAFEFTPETEIVSEAKFHLYGHDITLYPANDDTVTVDLGARLSDADITIRKLEAEIAELKATIAAQEREIEYLKLTASTVDANNNGRVDLVDCRSVLKYYTYSVVGLESGTVADYANFNGK